MDPSEELPPELVHFICYNLHYEDLCRFFYQNPQFYLTYVGISNSISDGAYFWQQYLLYRYGIKTKCKNIPSIRNIIRRLFHAHDYMILPSVPPGENDFWKDYLVNTYYVNENYLQNFIINIPFLSYYDYAKLIHDLLMRSFQNRSIIMLSTINGLFNIQVYDMLQTFPIEELKKKDFILDMLSTFINMNSKFQSWHIYDHTIPFNVEEWKNLSLVSIPGNSFKFIDVYYKYITRNSYYYITPIGIIKVNLDCRAQGISNLTRITVTTPQRHSTLHDNIRKIYEDICPPDGLLFSGLESFPG